MLVVVLFFQWVSLATAAPTVQTDCGLVEGIFTKPQAVDLSSFLGIPYGAPPVGREGRWKPSKPSSCWNGTLAAKTQPNACMQWHFTPPLQGESEDCLYLNVFTPSSSLASTSHQKSTMPNASAGALPVFVWLYGGDNCFGSSTSYGSVENIIDPLHLSVVVVVSFRLASLGFFSLKELSQEDPRGSSGNYAILDIQVSCCVCSALMFPARPEMDPA